jgi:uncharacterized protein YceK
MKPILLILLVIPFACLLGACGTMSTDPAPGGISAAETGMTTTTARQWQDRTIRTLAY